MQKEIKKAVVGMLIVFGSIFVISLIVPNKVGAAEMDSTERNPGLDKVTELGTAMKMWAIGFGAEAEKNAIESKQAFLNDVDRIKNSEFVRYQRDGWEQGKKDLAQTKEQIGDLFSSMGQALNKVFGGSDAE
jgi:hypothetical protein